MSKVTPPIIAEIHKCAYSILSEVRFFCDAEKSDLLKTTKNTITGYFSPVLDLSGFKFFYPTSGITDGLNCYSLANSDSTILVEDGDYGYLNYIHRGKSKESVISYVSNPCARDGNIRTHYFGERIILDCAYAGTTENRRISIDNVETVFVGLSKTFGIPDARVGFIFSNTPIYPLHSIIYSNLYFNPMSCVLTQTLMNTFELGYMHRLLHDKQLEASNGLVASDVVFLATEPNAKSNADIRGGVNRVCLQLNSD
jgi:hypothetical protein